MSLLRCGKHVNAPDDRICRDEFHHEFTLTLGQIQADMRDVAFYFRKKTGFPKLQDAGLADVVLGGQGLTVRSLAISLLDQIAYV